MTPLKNILGAATAEFPISTFKHNKPNKKKKKKSPLKYIYSLQSRTKRMSLSERKSLYMLVFFKKKKIIYVCLSYPFDKMLWKSVTSK